MITIEEYKEYLLNHYKYKIDSTIEKRRAREFMLTHYYKDDFLNKVIIDTYDFIKDILNLDTINSGYSLIDLDNDTSNGIDLMITGGGYSDYIYIDNNGRVISEYILKKVFGNTFSIEVTYDEIERNDDPDILSYDYYYHLYMQGFPKNLDEIKSKLFNNKTIIKK